MLKQFSKKTTGILTAADLVHPGNRLIYWVMLSLVLLASLVVVLPCLWVLLSCFKDTQEFYQIPPSLFPKNIRISKLGEVWKEYQFGKYYLNSLLLAAGEIVFAVVFNGLGGYALSRLNPIGGRFVYKMVFWSMLMPTSMCMVPLFMSFVNVPIFHVNITNSYLPMFLMAGANAFNLLLFRSFFNGIDMGYIEAARIDGCSDLNIFLKIILPLSLPIVMVISINSFNSAWSSFLWPYLIMKNDVGRTIAVKLFTLKGSFIPVDRYMCVIIFTIIPPCLVFMFFSKYIMGGINVGGIKG